MPPLARCCWRPYIPMPGRAGPGLAQSMSAGLASPIPVNDDDDNAQPLGGNVLNTVLHTKSGIEFARREPARPGCMWAGSVGAR
jgi:hypothetical protein